MRAYQAPGARHSDACVAGAKPRTPVEGEAAASDVRPASTTAGGLAGLAIIGLRSGGPATHKTNLFGRPLSARRAYLPWIAATGLATVSAGALQLAGSSSFERFLGPLPPAVTTAALGTAGLAALVFLERRGIWRRACTSRTVRGLAVATVAALPFAAVAITADIAIGFPQGTNVAWPAAWLLYPAVAVAAETVFHLLPLAALARITRSRFCGRRIDRPVLTLIALTALVEPVAQLALGSALPAFTVGHVYLIGVAQLLLLRRYGYLPMLWFRFSYYLLWHILWGEARLALLFGA